MGVGDGMVITGEFADATQPTMRRGSEDKV
jgi:hypothetical protein